MTLEFSSSSDDDVVDNDFVRERRRREASNPLPQITGRRQAQRRRQRDVSDSDADDPPPAPLPQGVTVGAWIPRRAGTIFHVSKNVYIPILNAQHNAGMYFGDPNRRARHRGYLDPSSISLRCVDDGIVSHLSSADDWLRLPIVLLSNAAVRGFYLAVDDAPPCAPEVVEEEKGAVPLMRTACRVSSQEERLYFRRTPCHRHSREHQTPANVSSVMSTDDVAEDASRITDVNMDLRIISIGCSLSPLDDDFDDSSYRLVVVRSSYITFSKLMGCDVTTQAEGDDTTSTTINAIFASTTSAFTRPCQAACIFRDTVLLAQLHPPRFLEIVFQTESFAVGTRLGGPRHGPPPPLPTAMALSGSSDGEGELTATSKEALILQDEKQLSIIDVANMRGRQMTLTAAGIGPTACIAQTIRGVVGTGSAIIVGGTSRGAVYALADDPRCKPSSPMVMSFGAHRDAATSGGGNPSFHDGGVQDVFMQGPFGFLSVARTGGCRLWDLRMCSSQWSQTETNVARETPCRPVASFHQPSRVAVDGGCSVAHFGSTIAICTRIGHVDLYCTRTGRHRGDVQHSTLSRNSAMALVPTSSMECGSAGVPQQRLFWTGSNRVSLHSAEVSN
ncbi:Hypothetical protein, putative [Bodo saltans]|uniref:Uncharacterized protein n=1 Tax=Bodo saltans TaxID=75058 RepID=A0A0S4IVV1_BODSA|nr:Hypothetical protein, putative [Bodo saltans]|eukprot:CUG02298.1 Hypothetical protein, putative [Bodo saltans]